jgi:hypothetical protein
VWQTREYRLWRKARDRAIQHTDKSDVPLEAWFNIKPQDILIPEICPVLGIPMTSGPKLLPSSSSLDRIDSKKGYIKGNIQVISHRANTLKSNATLKELELVIAHLRKSVSREGA